MNVTRNAGAGDVFLFHDSGDFITAAGASRDSTVQALPRVIRWAESKDLQMVDLDSMLAEARAQGWCQQLVLKQAQEKREKEQQMTAAARRTPAVNPTLR